MACSRSPSPMSRRANERRRPTGPPRPVGRLARRPRHQRKRSPINCSAWPSTNWMTRRRTWHAMWRSASTSPATRRERQRRRASFGSARPTPWRVRRLLDVRRPLRRGDAAVGRPQRRGAVRRGHTFDPYPYILLNLFLSMLAAIQAPVILMSQNRQSAKDRMTRGTRLRSQPQGRAGDHAAARQDRRLARAPSGANCSPCRPSS